MDQSHSTTHCRRKGQHLTFEERVIIQTRLKDGWSPNKIAAEIGCAPNTVRNEIKRGTVDLYRGHVQRYKAKAGQAAYDANRKNSCRHYEYLKKRRFIKYVEQHFREEGWSIDACTGRAVLYGGFDRSEVVCTRTLYRYIDLGLIPIKNIDLPEKLRRRASAMHPRKNRRILGRSIEERPGSVQGREEFGHWEADLVIGNKTGADQALLTLAERKTRNFFMIPIPDKKPESVMAALQDHMSTYGEHMADVFKTITTDNGSEFSQLSSLEDLSGTLVYFAHPYMSCEKGTVERHNGLIRRFIPKGHRIDEYSPEQISDIELWCNALPRKILGYRTPEEAFDQELDRIYAA